MTYKCEVCEFETSNVKIKANHVRWKHRDNSLYRNLMVEIKTSLDEKRIGKLKEYTVKCNTCSLNFSIIEREKLFPLKEKYFCSRKCANSKENGHSEITKSKISVSTSISLKKKWTDEIYANKCLKNIGKRRFTSKGEETLRNHIISKYQYDGWTFGIKKLAKDSFIVRDLYSDKLRVCVEYDGVWHFKDIHGQLEDKKRKDAFLEEWCLKNQYRLIRISEDVYKTNTEHWTEVIENEIYHGKDSIRKFY